MNDRMIERERMKAEFRPQERDYFDVSDQVIGMNQGRIVGTFSAPDRNIPHFDLHVEWDHMKAADFRMAAGNPLHFGDNFSAHIILK